MQLPDTVAELHAALLEIYVVRAQARYGLLKLTQLQHAVQAAALACRGGLPASLVAAALLHDIGHMLYDDGRAPAPDCDDRHENVGAAWLGRFFGPAVTEPVRLHVAAKRYLCAAEPGYTAALSHDSFASLMRQGGPMHAAERQAFEREPYHREAVLLRRLDDAAKDPDGPLPPFGTFWMDIEAALEQSFHPG